MFIFSACEQRVQTAVGAPIKDRQYFASSISPGGEAHLASLSNAGVWVPAESYGSDRNQFLQIDFERLMKVTKVSQKLATVYFSEKISKPDSGN